MALSAQAIDLEHDPRAGVVKIRVETFDGGEDVGVGTVIGADVEEGIALILTAAHVIDDAQKTEVVFWNKRHLTFEGRIFSEISDDLDMGVVIVQLGASRSLLTGFPRYGVGDTKQLEVGATVRTIGHPLDLSWSTSTNTIRELRERTDNRKLTFSDTGISPGSSGGPLFDSNFRLVGMVLKQRPQDAVATKIEAIVEALGGWGVRTDYLNDGGETEPLLAVVEVPVPATATESQPLPSSPPVSADAPGEEQQERVVFDPERGELNRSPNATADSGVTDEDSLVTVEVLGNDLDPDGDSLTVIDFERETKRGGTVGFNGSIATYIPPENYHGDDSFTYTISDGGLEDKASVHLLVVPVNDSPVISVTDSRVAEGDALLLLPAATDVDGDDLTYSAEGLPEGANVDPATGALSFVPTFDTSAPDSETSFEIDFIVTDSERAQGRQTVTVVVEDVPGGLDPGREVTRTLVDPAGSVSATMRFDEVTGPGIASIVTRRDFSLLPPQGQRLSGNTYFVLNSTATHTGQVDICVDYSSLGSVDEDSLTLHRFVARSSELDDGLACIEDGGCWQPISVPSRRSPSQREQKLICGTTTDVSPVALFERLTIEPSVSLVRKGESVSVSLPTAAPDSVEQTVADWGDGTVDSQATGGAEIQVAHRYSRAGVRQVAVDLVSEGRTVGSASFGPIIVYDPAAGDLTVRGSTTGPNGKIELTVNSGYDARASAPSGNVVFRFGGQRFRSRQHRWLIIDGGRALIEGQGEIGASGGYSFLISAIDGDLEGGLDRVRVKLWHTESGKVIFDTAPDASLTDDPTGRIDGGRGVRIKR